MLRTGCLILLALLLAACSDPPPKHSTNICKIFQQYPQWYWAAQKAQKQWGVPISVQMAIIYEESSFRDNAMTPRWKILGLIPWDHESTATGYSQALNQTWQQYLAATHRRGASRGSFSHATDFIGWFAAQAQQQLNISKTDTFDLYLAYHEGLDGYRNHSYIRKPWLVHIAQGVHHLANRYQRQLVLCEAKLPQKPWWRFW